MLRSDILRMPTVAYYSGYNGIEIKEIKGDLVYCVSGTFSGSKRTVHMVKVHYDTDKPYFKIDGKRIRLDECMRV